MPEPVITTARSARHDLPYLFPGQAQKEAFVNEALTRIDALLHPAILAERADPPANPAPGDCYIVAAAPAGEWAGHTGAIAIWAENQWLFALPRAGIRVHDAETGSLAAYDPTTGWRRVLAPAPPAGGATQDAEARAALAAIVEGLRNLGIFS